MIMATGAGNLPYNLNHNLETAIWLHQSFGLEGIQTDN